MTNHRSSLSSQPHFHLCFSSCALYDVNCCHDNLSTNSSAYHSFLISYWSVFIIRHAWLVDWIVMTLRLRCLFIFVCLRIINCAHVIKYAHELWHMCARVLVQMCEHKYQMIKHNSFYIIIHFMYSYSTSSMPIVFISWHHNMLIDHNYF